MLDRIPKVRWSVPIKHTLEQVAVQIANAIAVQPSQAASLLEAAQAVKAMADECDPGPEMAIELTPRELLVKMIDKARENGRGDIVKRLDAIIAKLKDGEHAVITASVDYGLITTTGQLNQVLDRMEATGKSILTAGA